MKGKHHGIDIECFSRRLNGEFAAEYQLIFQDGTNTYVIKKSSDQAFPTKIEAELDAMESAKYQIDKALF